MNVRLQGHHYKTLLFQNRVAAGTAVLPLWPHRLPPATADCSEGQIIKKAVYIAIGINLDGKKDVLGMWVGENESAKFWASVLNSLRNRGVQDIFIACTDNLAGFTAAIEAVFPKTEIQNCIIHQLRNSCKYVSYKDLKALMADLKAV